VGIFIPLEQKVIQRCPYCRAIFEERWVLGISLTSELHEGSFCSFYRNEVDPGHVHTWAGGVSSHMFTHDLRLGDYSPHVVDYFDADALVSILRSFPTRTERKAFIRKFSIPQVGHDALCERVYNAQEPLRKAHKADPFRKDWPRILKQQKLWP
jgi:hypothetical protein